MNVRNIPKGLRAACRASAKRQIEQEGSCWGIYCHRCPGSYEYDDARKTCYKNGWKVDNNPSESNSQGVTSCKQFLKDLDALEKESDAPSCDELLECLEWAVDHMGCLALCSQCFVNERRKLADVLTRAGVIDKPKYDDLRTVVKNDDSHGLL